MTKTITSKDSVVASTVARPVFKIKTSMFSFLKCLRCFVLEVKHSIGQPSGPSSFGQMMTQKSEQIALLKDKWLSILGEAFPKAKIVKSNGRFNSLMIPVLGADVVLNGGYDLLLQAEDGSYILAAFKTSDPTKNLGEYAKQLNAIAYALDHKDKEPVTISKLGIFVFNPTAYLQNMSTEETYNWIDVPLDKDAFKTQLQSMVNVLSDDTLPAPGEDEKGKLCAFCERDMKLMSLNAPMVAQQA